MTRRTKPRACDAPGCPMTVRPGMLMCREHWFATPKPLRDAITDAWKAGRIRDWSANCLEARTLHAARRAARAPTTTPQRAYDNAARLLGEQ